MQTGMVPQGHLAIVTTDRNMNANIFAVSGRAAQRGMKNTIPQRAHLLPIFPQSCDGRLGMYSGEWTQAFGGETFPLVGVTKQ